MDNHMIEEIENASLVANLDNILTKIRENRIQGN
jgi:hypothetical protein